MRRCAEFTTKRAAGVTSATGATGAGELVPPRSGPYIERVRPAGRVGTGKSAPSRLTNPVMSRRKSTEQGPE